MSSRIQYFPNLDALRFIAFLLVFNDHIDRICPSLKFPFLPNSGQGVRFFFVLSGFLISYLLLNEKKSNQTIDLKTFYTKRILRIWPVYFLTVFIGFSIAISSNYFNPLSLPFGISIAPKYLIYYLLFLGNICVYLYGSMNMIVSITWSISIEEQFYIIAPLIFKFFNNKTLLRSIILIILIAGYKIFQNRTDGFYIYYYSYCCFLELGMGCLLGYLTFNSNWLISNISTASKLNIIIVYALGILMLIIQKSVISRYGPIFHLVTNLINSTFFGYIILEQNFATHSIGKLGKLKIMSYLGKISYGLYCYHMIIIFLVGYLINNYISNKFNIWQESMIYLISLGLTILIASISFKSFEKYFLGLRKIHIKKKHIHYAD